MAANTVVINALNTTEVLRTVNIVDVADVTFPGADNQGEYVYGAYTFFSPQIVPASGGYVVVSSSGRNEYMTAVQYSANYSAIGAGSGSITALTDNSGGTASGTLADSNNAVTGVDGVGNNAASKVDVDARLVTLTNSIASLAAKVNSLIAAG